MSDVPTISTAEVGGFRIDTNSGASQKDIETALAPPPPPGEDKDDPSKAASELGKLGGKASAEKRAAEAKKAAKAEKQDAKDLKTESTDDKPEAKEAKAEEPEEPEAEDKPKDEKPLGKPRDDPRARMLEATRKEAEAKRERDRIKADYDRLRAENEALKRGERPAEPQPTVEAKPAEGKPVPEEFEDYEKYLDARDDWNRKRWTEEQSKERHNQEVEQKLDEVVDNLVAAVRDSGVRENLSEDITSLKSTFALMAENHRDGVQNPETARHWMMNEFLFSPEQAPALMLHLSEHPDEFQRIAALTTPRAVSRELAKIEARLEAATTGNGSKPKEEVSKAAPPVKPVSGAPYVAESAEYKPGESLDSYLARHRRRPTASR